MSLACFLIVFSSFSLSKMSEYRIALKDWIDYCRHIQYGWWKSSALGSPMSPVTTDNKKKLSIRRLYFGLHVRVGTYISRIETYLRAIQVQHSSRLGWYGMLLVICLAFMYKVHAVGASCYILTQQCSCRNLSIRRVHMLRRFHKRSANCIKSADRKLVGDLCGCETHSTSI